MRLKSALWAMCSVLALGAALTAQTGNQQGTMYPSQDQTTQPAQPSTPDSGQPPAVMYPATGESANTATPAMERSNVIPAGTQLAIRTNGKIEATSKDVGKQYPVEISQPVTDQAGNIIIPQHSPATLTIADVSSGTMGVGSNQVALALQSVTANGRTYTIQTNQVQQRGESGIGANKRTAQMTGGGAVLGTVIGALAGGGKGAAIGAVVGGVGGATAQVLTRGKQVTVPAESVLTFKLDQPVTLQ